LQVLIEYDIPNTVLDLKSFPHPFSRGTVFTGLGTFTFSFSLFSILGQAHFFCSSVCSATSCDSHTEGCFSCPILFESRPISSLQFRNLPPCFYSSTSLSTCFKLKRPFPDNCYQFVSSLRRTPFAGSNFRPVNEGLREFFSNFLELSHPLSLRKFSMPFRNHWFFRITNVTLQSWFLWFSL